MQFKFGGNESELEKVEVACEGEGSGETKIGC